MSMPTVFFKDEQGMTCRGTLRGEGACVDREKRVVRAWNGRKEPGRLVMVDILPEQIISANEEAWTVGITWAPIYISTGYGAGEKGWGAGSEYGLIPEEKRRMLV